jgi:hypothetical protein
MVCALTPVGLEDFEVEPGDAAEPPVAAAAMALDAPDRILVAMTLPFRA